MTIRDTYRRRTWVTRVLAPVFAVLGLVAAQLGAATTAQAIPMRISIGEGMASCPSGYFCLWRDANYKGYGVALFADELNFGGMPSPFRQIDNQATSLYNNSAWYAWLYPDPNFGEGDGFIGVCWDCSSPNVGTEFRPEMNDALSSINIVDNS